MYQGRLSQYQAITAGSVLATLIGVALLCSLLIAPLSNAERYDAATADAKKQEIIVYTYHSKPPYVNDIFNEQGSYYDFVTELNSLSDKYHFTLHFLPRNRLDRYLKENKVEGFVIGANPKWFKDIKQTRYLWSKAIFSDRDEFVSLTRKPFEYTGAQSLHDKTVGASRGYVYRGVDTLVAKGLTKRIDAVDEAAVFKLLLKGRIDIAIISQKSLPTFFKDNQNNENFTAIGQSGIYLSKRPHDEFTRHLMIPKNLTTLFYHLQEIVPTAAAKVHNNTN